MFLRNYARLNLIFFFVITLNQNNIFSYIWTGIKLHNSHWTE